MRILYVGAKWDYGDPRRGLGFEHYNFALTLQHLATEFLYFDVLTLAGRHGFERMSRLLKEVVQSEKPDLTFCVLTGDQLSRRTMRNISESGLTKTVNWYCDDHFNFETFSRRWTPAFNWVVTTSASAFPKYAQHGMHNVIKSQWGCNHYIYRKLDLPLKYDVTFVGARHGNRPAFIEALRRAGVDVRCWGSGWEQGRLDQDGMIALFNQSRINLNFTNGAECPAPWRAFRYRIRDRIFGALESFAFGKKIKNAYVGLRRTGPSAPAPEPPPPSDLRTLVPSGNLQIKGRTFEVPACGGFLLTGAAENLPEYLAENVDAGFYRNAAELITQVQLFLANEDRRAAVAQQGYARTLREHTYLHRYHDIFRQIGLPPFDLEKVLPAAHVAGVCREIQ